MIELKKYHYRQTKDGCIISFVMHPNDIENNLELINSQIGTVFNAEFTKAEQEG